jgi:hypothetical protein
MIEATRKRAKYIRNLTYARQCPALSRQFSEQAIEAYSCSLCTGLASLPQRE